MQGGAGLDSRWRLLQLPVFLLGGCHSCQWPLMIFEELEMLLPIARPFDALGFDADLGPHIFLAPPDCYSLCWVKVAAFVARSRADRPLQVTLPDDAGRRGHGINDSALAVGMHAQPHGTQALHSKCTPHKHMRENTCQLACFLV